MEIRIYQKDGCYYGQDMSERQAEISAEYELVGTVNGKMAGQCVSSSAHSYHHTIETADGWDENSYLVAYSSNKCPSGLNRLVDFGVTEQRIVENVHAGKYRMGAWYFRMEQLQKPESSESRIAALIEQVKGLELPGNDLGCEDPFTILDTFLENVATPNPVQVIRIWEDSKDKESVGKLFELITGISFEGYLNEAVSESSVARHIAIDGVLCEVNLPARITEGEFRDLVQEYGSGVASLDQLEQEALIHGWRPVQDIWEITRTEGEEDGHTEM